MAPSLPSDIQDAWAVRVQDGWHGARERDGHFELLRPVDWRLAPHADILAMAPDVRREQAQALGYRFARDTFHFTLDSLVSDHALGKFSGAIVVLAPLAGLANPMGLHRDDTWAHAGADGSLRCPGAIVLCPEGMPAPEELRPFVRFYRSPDPKTDPEGFKAAREEATREALKSVGRPFRRAGTAAIHMGSASEAMESALDGFQAAMAEAIAKGPSSWANDRLSLTTPEDFEPWMSMPKGEAAALAASREQRLEMIEKLKVAERLARESEGMGPVAIERFSKRADACRQALFESAPSLDRAALAWGKALANERSCAAAPPAWPGVSDDAYWDWVVPRLDDMARGGSQTSMAELESRARAGALGSGGAIAFIAMDGCARAKPAQELFPEAFAAMALPPPLEEVDFAAKLSSRRLAALPLPPLPAISPRTVAP